MDYFNQESERLQFRKLTEADIPRWLEFFKNNDRLKFIGLDLTKPHETLAEEWILAQLKRYETQGLGHLAIVIKETQEFIGMCGILPRELNGRKEYEVAYSLIPRFWKKGYGTEAAKQMKQFGFENIETDRLVSIIDKNNIDSIHVAQKNGMKVLFETEYLGMFVKVFGIEKK